LQVNDVFSRTSVKEYLMFVIVGVVYFAYSALASDPPVHLWKDVTPKQKRLVRGGCLLASGFMIIWGVWHLVS
jgi:hypothetical protein